MLKQRIITALVLLAILMPAMLYSDPRAFAAVAMAMVGASAWEWGRLNGCSQLASWACGAACALLCALSWSMGGLQAPAALWTVSGGAWVLVGAWLLRRGVAHWSRIPRGLRLVTGLLALWLAWLAVAQARVIGVNFMLSVLTLVWVADIFAYFAGRGMGGRFFTNKLAPSISPGKTWEGVIGGMSGVLLLAAVWIAADSHWAAVQPSFYTLIAGRSAWLLLLALLFMAAMSVVGDLVESLIKRAAGAKDSSGLLPGHGGFLDRLDALLPTLPLAMMIYSLVAA
jgi:phosphatidate cytidylyltransferase